MTDIQTAQEYLVRIVGSECIAATRAGEIAAIVEHYDCEAQLRFGGKIAEATNATAVMLLSLSPNDEFILKISGPDATEAYKELLELPYLELVL